MESKCIDNKIGPICEQVVVFSIGVSSYNLGYNLFKSFVNIYN